MSTDTIAGRVVWWTLTLFVVSVPLVIWAVDPGVALTASHLLAMVLLVLATGIWLRQRPPIPWDLATVSLLAFVLVAAVSLVSVQRAPNLQVFSESTHGKSAKQFIGIVFGVSVFFGLYCAMCWYGLARHVWRVHYWTTVGIGCLTLVQYAIAVADISSPWANFAIHNSTFGETRPLSLLHGFPRVGATLSEPTYLASYLLVGWAFLLFSLKPQRLSGWRDLAFLASGVVVGTAILVAGSRRGYLIFGALALGAVLVRGPRVLRSAVVGGSLVLGVALTGTQQVHGVIVTLLPGSPMALNDLRSTPASDSVPGEGGMTGSAETPGPPSTRSEAYDDERDTRVAPQLVATHDRSIQLRFVSYLVAWQVLRDHPLTGGGVGTSGFFMERYFPREFTSAIPDRTEPMPMISQYATIATETGLLGLLCFVGLVWAVVRRLRDAARMDPDIVRGAAAALLAYALAAVSDVLLTYQMLLVWLLLAGALALGRNEGWRGAPRSSGA